MKKFLLGLLVCLSLACGDGPTNPPSPPLVTRPSPGPTPFPIPEADLSRVKVSYAVCCAPPPESGEPDWGIVLGWPYISPEAAEEVRKVGIQLIHIRTEPAGPNSLEALRDTVTMLGQKGLLAEVTLLDGWHLRHGGTPWGEGCEVTRRAPREHHVQWVSSVVRHSLASNVVYDIGNEIGLCRPSNDWYEGIARAAREEASRLGRSNIQVGGDRDLPFLDYYNYHGFHVEHSSKPVSIMNESNNLNYSPEEWAGLIQRGIQEGVIIGYWPGPHTEAQRKRTLELIGKVLSGVPVDICTAPPSCPPLVRFGLSVYRTEGELSAASISTKETRKAVADGYAIWNSTPRFGSGHGRPCNDEHHDVCSSECGAWRRCEDPRGPEWIGAEPLKSNSYLGKSSLQALVQVCANDGWKDAEGQPVHVENGQVCSIPQKATP